MSGAPAADARTLLVLLPGLDGTGLVFEPLLECLPERIEPLVVSYPAERPMSFREHVDYARAQLPADRPFVLLAESFSGPVGLALLAEPPANLAGVIFVATFARHPSPFVLDFGLHLPQGVLRRLFATAPFSRFFCLGSAPAAAVRLFCRALLSVELRVLTQRLRVLAELPPPAPTPFAGPVLYIQAGSDRLVPARGVDGLRDLLPQLRVERLAGPHIVLLARPAEGARLIDAFVDRLAPSA